MFSILLLFMLPSLRGAQQTMLGSPHIKPNKAEATAWEGTLLTVQSTLEEWLAVQRSWLYLQVRERGYYRRRVGQPRLVRHGFQ
jgi:hypothetical protein